jgi:hypothetical protein
MTQSKFYIEILLSECLEGHWAAWFEELNLSETADGCTLLCGQAADQAAIHGILERIRDLNLNLVSVQVKHL